MSRAAIMTTQTRIFQSSICRDRVQHFSSVRGEEEREKKGEWTVASGVDQDVLLPWPIA